MTALDGPLAELLGEGRSVPNEPDDGWDADPGGAAGRAGDFGIVDGADWLAEGSAAPEPLWGDEQRLLAVRRQPTVIAGPQGAGKTSVAGQLMLGVMGVAGYAELLGLPVVRTDRSVLYLAADRPDQARLSLRRMVHPELVRNRLSVKPGPPPGNVVQRPTLLLDMAESVGAGLVVIDSLKDVALRLSDDEVGASVNLAVQHLVAEGIDVVALHHPRKQGSEEGAEKPRRLDDLYGSTWLTSGAGSVLYLHPTGSGEVELLQFKSPNGEIGTVCTFRHDPVTGALERSEGVGRQVARIIADAGPDGITVMHIARVLTRSDAPSDRARKKVERAVGNLADEGRIETVPGVGKGIRWRMGDAT